MFCIDQDWVGKAKGLDAIRKLADLLLRMSTCVLRPRFQLGNRYVLNLRIRCIHARHSFKEGCAKFLVSRRRLLRREVKISLVTGRLSNCKRGNLRDQASTTITDVEDIRGPLR